MALPFSKDLLKTVDSTMQSGLIFDVKKYSINDGPGIRVTLFLKGCPLHCAWCHNPESIATKVQKMFNRDKCIGCGWCFEACPYGACSMTKEGIVTLREHCRGCGKCAEGCPTLANEMSGRTASVAELVAIVEKERVFFDESNGGVTLSGGEPLYQPEFALALLEAFSARGIHRALDTTGFVKTETLLSAAKYTNLFLYDLKVMDAGKHKHWTGVSNELILSNLKQLAATGADIHIRIPLVRGVNDDDANITQTAAFVATLPGPKKRVSLLPYHNIMANKHIRLGHMLDSLPLKEPRKIDLDRVTGLFGDFGVCAQVGG